jgi:hypothetical protein
MLGMHLESDLLAFIINVCSSSNVFLCSFCPIYLSHLSYATLNKPHIKFNLPVLTLPTFAQTAIISILYFITQCKNCLLHFSL